MAHVTVIGGGCGGVAVAEGLGPIVDVALIEQKDQFIRHTATPRTAVDTVWGHAIFVPYMSLSHRDEVLRDAVSRVDGTTVHVSSHDPIEADCIVLVTGSTCPFPAKYSSYRPSVARACLEQLHENLGRIHSVMIVGGSTVDIELAGKLVNAFPGLDIAIVEISGQTLSTPDYTDMLRNEINEQSGTLGIRVITGPELTYLPPQNVGDFSHFMIETKNGEVIGADLWFQCYDARANTSSLIGSDYESVVSPNGITRVDSTMEVADHPSVYAVGNLTDVRESKRANAAHQQTRVVITGITARVEGEKPDAIYQPTKGWVILPLGPDTGMLQPFDASGQTRILGVEQAVEIKGTDLMVSVIRSQLNLP